MKQNSRDRMVQIQLRQASSHIRRLEKEAAAERQRADKYKSDLRKKDADYNSLRREAGQVIRKLDKRARDAAEESREHSQELVMARANHDAIITRLEQELEERTRQAEECQAEAEEYKHGWRRERTDFENYRKHTENERDLVSRQASMAMLRELLPVLDDFDRAMGSIPESMTDNPWLGGISIIQRKFQALLGKFEVEPVDPTGELFDPNWHEAVGTVECGTATRGMVAETLQKGYRAGEILLRAALVKVAR